MRWPGRRLYLGIAGLSVPAIATVLLGGYFLVDKVPKLVRNERSRVTREYREQLVELRSSADGGRAVVRGKGGNWETLGKMAPGRWGVCAAEPCEADGIGGGERMPEGKVLLWYDDGKGRTTAWWGERVEPFDIELWMYVGVPVVLLVLVGMTLLGIRFFYRYASERDDFIKATAHDLKTPLVGMRMMIGTDDGEARRLNEQMIRMVRNLEDFQRLGGKRPQPQLAAVDLRSACDSAYALFRDDYRELRNGGDIAVEGAAVALADETMVVQILWNLLANELKYAAPHGQVAVRLSMDERRAVVEFRDEGPGMSAKERRRAFDRYYRARRVTKSGKGGFGIGLCTAREFARALGGELAVADNRPRGCVFTLTLPPATI